MGLWEAHKWKSRSFSILDLHSQDVLVKISLPDILHTHPNANPNCKWGCEQNMQMMQQLTTKFWYLDLDIDYSRHEPEAI